jgi:thiol-disulfide isomerase/thioredoxin
MHMLGVAVPLLLTMVLPAQSPSESAAEVPRYRLEVGQRLSYASAGGAEYTRQSNTTTAAWTVWVTRRNGDGSWRLIVRCIDSTKWTYEGQPDEGNATERTQWAWCDLFPDGSITDNESTRFGPKPTALFPRLPQDAQQLRDGWTTEADGTRVRYTARPAEDAGTFAFDVVWESDQDAIYLTSREGTCTFDRGRGLLTENRQRYAQGYGFVGKGTSATTLQDVATCASDEIALLDADFATCFAALQHWSAALSAAAESKDMDASFAAAKKALVGARAEVEDPAALALLDERIAAHDRQAQYTREAAAQRAAVLDQPSPQWETTDLHGARHSVASHRGEVMVLDFWYRGCGWCIKAMPQIQQVAEHFAGKPVAVLGMNTDRDVADARFVADAMALSYPTLKAQGIPEKYGIHGFPTLVIIDRHGVVRAWHVGYSATLRDRVVAEVEKLLREPGPAEK